MLPGVGNQNLRDLWSHLRVANNKPLCDPDQARPSLHSSVPGDSQNASGSVVLHTKVHEPVKKLQGMSRSFWKQILGQQGSPTSWTLHVPRVGFSVWP